MTRDRVKNPLLGTIASHTSTGIMYKGVARHCLAETLWIARCDHASYRIGCIRMTVYFLLLDSMDQPEAAPQGYEGPNNGCLVHGNWIVVTR